MSVHVHFSHSLLTSCIYCQSYQVTHRAHRVSFAQMDSISRCKGYAMVTRTAVMVKMRRLGSVTVSDDAFTLQQYRGLYFSAREPV